MEFIYQCPVCKQKLQQLNKSFMCPQNHTYDISREGYINLLLANQKGTKNPGDSKFMAKNREVFLNKGYYTALADEINKIILGHCVETIKASGANHKFFNILDIGCGTGFYSSELEKSFKNKFSKDQVQLWGIDISKPAIQKAAKRYANIQFSIGSSFNLPYLNESVDIIFSIFSPFNSKDLFRVLKPGGQILMVRPGANHLKELGELIYGRFQLQGNPLDLSEDLQLNFSLVEKSQLEYQIHLKKNEDIMSLVAMTPYHWHLNAEKEKLLAQTSELTTSVDFQLSVFQKALPTERERIS